MTSNRSNVILKGVIKSGGRKIIQGVNNLKEEGTMKKRIIVMFIVLVGLSLFVLPYASNQAFTQTSTEVASGKTRTVELHVQGCE